MIINIKSDCFLYWIRPFFKHTWCFLWCEDFEFLCCTWDSEFKELMTSGYCAVGRRTEARNIGWWAGVTRCGASRRGVLRHL